MGRETYGMFLLAALSGCGLATSLDRPVTPTTPAAFTNVPCRAVARQRADDAAVNGYDTALQIRIARDAYDNCLKLARPATP